MFRSISVFFAIFLISTPSTSLDIPLSLRISLSLECPLGKAVKLQLREIEIKELNLKAQNALISVSENKTISINLEKGSLSSIKALKLLQDTGILRADEKLKKYIGGILSFKNLRFFLNSTQRFYTEIEEVSIKNAKIVGNVHLKNLYFDMNNGSFKWIVDSLTFGNSTINGLSGKGFIAPKKTSVSLYLGKGTIDLSILPKILEIGGIDPIEKINEKLPWLGWKTFSPKGSISFRSFNVDLATSKDKTEIKKWSFLLDDLSLSCIPRPKTNIFLNFQGRFSGIGNKTVSADDIKGNIKISGIAYKGLNNKIFLNLISLSLENATASYAGNFTAHASINLKKLLGDIRTEKDTFRINLLKEANIITHIKNNQYAISIPKPIELQEGEKGFLSICGDFIYPLDILKSSLKIHAKDLHTSSIYLKKLLLEKKKTEKDAKLSASFILSNTTYHLRDGRISWLNKKFSMDLRHLEIIPPKKKKKQKATKTKKLVISEKPFDFTPLKNLKKFAHEWKIFISRISYDDIFDIDRFSGSLIYKNEVPVFSFNGEGCFLNFNISGSIENYKKLSITGEVKTISSPMDTLLACFIKEAPVYVTGSFTMRAVIDAEGESPKDMMNSTEYRVVSSVEDGKIMRISNLKKSLGILLKILSLVKLNPTKLKDTLVFNNLELVFSGNAEKLEIKKFSLDSPLLKLNIIAQGEVLKLLNEIDRKVTVYGRVGIGGIGKDFRITYPEEQEDTW